AVGTFSGQDIGGPLPGSTSYDSTNGIYTVKAGGADIWANADQFHFAWQLRTNDFDIKVRVESLTLENDYTKAGLMARESLAAGSPHVYASVFADNRPRANNVGGYEMVYRITTGGLSDAIYPPLPQPLVSYPNGWLRLRRAGNEFTAFASSNGVSWIKYATTNLALPPTIYFGMGVTSHDNTRLTTARFRDFAGNRAHAHYYPSRQDCLTCHTPVAGHVLGVKTHQLNGLFSYPGTGNTDNQLRTWNHLGLFNPPLNEADIATLSASTAITNSGATLEHRVRSYLAANCAQCHRPNGVARANFDARFDTPLALQGIVGGVPNETLGLPGARLVAPKSPPSSILHRRVNTVDSFKMPPLARNTIDPDAVATITAWINSLPSLGSDFIGLRSEYFDNIDLTGLKLTRADETINFDWGTGSPDPAIGPDTFSVRWTGQIEPKFSETYTFFTTTDDGVRLWVDGQLLIDHWADQPLTEYSGSIALLAGHKYDLRMEYFENAGLAVARLAWSSPSQPKEIVSPEQLVPPADGWLDRDLGGVALAGRATHTNRDFSVTASGADIWDYADGFHFVYQPLAGDGLIVARVAGLENTDGWAKAGVMMRESLAADSPHALMAITSGFGAAFQRRPVAGGLSLHTAGPTVTVPRWVKLVRTGNRFTGSVSSDGLAWTEVGGETIAMAPSLYAGLAVTAHNNGVLGTATFTDVELNTAPSLRLLERMTNGTVRLQLIGQTGAGYCIEISTNLTNWALLGRLTGTNVASEFLDPQAAPSHQRFYRGLLAR
ncbi:MAG TPA: PA14 domain-containing protein, partial [Verrucomicrobiae bacterium]